MEQADRDTIQRNIVRLSSLVDLEALYRELIQREVIDQLFIERIKTKYSLPQEQAQEFFLNYTRRGPHAFQILIESLEASGHISEANILRSPRQFNYNHATIHSTSYGDVSSTTGRNENSTNNGPFLSSSSSNSPTSSTSVPSSPLMRPNASRVEPLSGSNSPSSSCSSISASVSAADQIRSGLASCTMSEQGPLIVQVKSAEQYNMGVHTAYTMMSKPRGFALIVNNIEFLGDDLAKREGAEKDTAHLQELLTQLGFEVMIRHNVKKMELIHPDTGILKKFLDQFKSKTVDACIVAIMSHGKEGYIRSSDAEDFRNPTQNYWHFNEEIQKLFNNRYCPLLKGKPKIFIVQACQVERRDRGVRRTQTDGKDLTTAESQVSSSLEWNIPPPPPEKLPETEDIIACFSTVPGFVSNRDVEHGTWYICALCKVFMNHAWNTDLMKLLQKVGLEMRNLTCEYGSKQMSSFHVLGFHYDLYFNPGLFEDGLSVNSNGHSDQVNGDDSVTA